MTDIYTKSKKAGNAVAIISLKRIKENFNYLHQMTSPAICMPVLKANAYGLGAKEVAMALSEKIEGCFVATPSEGYALMQAGINRQKKIDIFVLHGFLPNESSKIAQLGLIPVLNTLQQALEWHIHHKNKSCAIQIDSGMSRFGLSKSNVTETFLQDLNIKLVLTHLACASEKEHPKNREQLEKFLKITNQYFPHIPRSISASEGIFLGKEFHLEVIRPGIELYGNLGGTFSLKNAVSIKAPIFQIAEYDSGQSFGYGNDWTAKRKTVSATIGIGYADSCLTSKKRHRDIFLWKDEMAFPIIGRISMDSIIVDITDYADKIQVGDFVELLGDHQSLASLAASCEITPHEILTSIGKRIVREYIPSELA